MRALFLMMILLLTPPALAEDRVEREILPDSPAPAEPEQPFGPPPPQPSTSELTMWVSAGLSSFSERGAKAPTRPAGIQRRGFTVDP